MEISRVQVDIVYMQQEKCVLVSVKRQTFNSSFGTDGA